LGCPAGMAGGPRRASDSGVRLGGNVHDFVDDIFATELFYGSVGFALPNQECRSRKLLIVVA
jgi:hypothetical protein